MIAIGKPTVVVMISFDHVMDVARGDTAAFRHRDRGDRGAGDAHFAMSDFAMWDKPARQRHPAGEADSVDFSYVTYRQRDPD